MRTLTLLACLMIMPVLTPVGASAQFTILPSAGMYAPLSDLLDARDGSGDPSIEAGKKSSTLALGLGAELGSSGSKVGLRLQLGYATASDVPIEGVGCADCDLRSTLLTGTAGLIFRPLPNLLLLRPHFVLGAGVKRYGFEREDLEEEGWEEVLRNQTQPTLHLAVGGALNLGVISPRIELGAFVSRIDGVSEGESTLDADDDLQTDLFLTVAIPILGG